MKTYSIYILLAALLLTSCNDFLDIKPKHQVMLDVTADYESLLNYYSVIQTIGIYSCLMTDDVFFPDEDSTGMSIKAQPRTVRNFYSFNEELYSINETDGDWYEQYHCIYTYNTVIEGVLSSSGGTEQEKKQIHAEALLGRAFLYSCMSALYAKTYNENTATDDPCLPLVLEADINMKNLTRASVRDVYEKIISDLKEAIPSLPQYPKLNAYRGSKAAAHGLLGRLYLHQGKYELALEHVKTALDDVSVLTDYNLYEVVDSIMTIGRNNVPFLENNPENIYIRITSFSNGMSGRTYVNPKLLELFDPASDRRYQLFMTDKFNNRKRPYIVWAPTIDPNLGIATPELYLTAAECEARTGNADEAMKYLNELRKNRYLNHAPISASSAKEAVRLVLDERRRELMMTPPLRLADIKRLAFDPDNAQVIELTTEGQHIRIEPTSNKLVMPIPPLVLQYNPGMEDNPRN